MESGDRFLDPQDTATVRVANEIPVEKKHMTSWWTKENWPRLKKDLVNSRYPDVIGNCDESCLELGLDTVPKQTVLNILQRIGRKTIKYENSFPKKKRALLLESQIKYVEDIILKIDI